MDEHKNLHIKYKIAGDSPTNNAVFFNFDTYSDSIVSIIQESQIETPFTIAINGKWGSGKTSLMKTIKNKLDGSYRTSPRKIKTVWFDAWKYTENNPLLAELAFEIYQEVVKEKGIIKNDLFHRIWRKLRFYKDTKRINSFNIIADFSNILINSAAITQEICPLKKSELDVKKWINEPFYEKNLTFYRRFQQYLQAVLNIYVFDGKGSANLTSDGFLVIFIDDLDRCSPNMITNILESINLFFDQKGCVFVLGMDLNVISNSIEMQYEKYIKSEDNKVFSGRDYLKKMVQLEFSLPEIRPEDMKIFVETLIGNDQTLHALLQNSTLIIETLGGNIREIKRFINLFKFVKTLQYYHRNLDVDDELLIKWLLLDFTSGDFISQVKNDPELLITMQNLVQPTAV